MTVKRKITALCCAAAMALTASQVTVRKSDPVVRISAAEPSDPDLIMRYTSEAGTYSTDNAFNNDESFYKALPLGNGRIGAMVYGNCPTEWIDLNEATVWSAGPGSNDKNGAANHLKEVQNLLSQGKYKEANNIIGGYMIGGGQAKYQKVGMLKIGLGHERPGSYTRQLDLNTGVATTEYDFGGKHYIRESFVSYPDQVMITRVRCNTPGSVSCSIGYDGLLNGNSFVDGDRVIATGHGDDDCWTKGAVYYCAGTQVVPDGGRIEKDGSRINASGCDSVMLITAIRTNFIDAQTCNGDEKGDCDRDLKAVSGKTYDKFLERHTADFSELMHRVDLDLGGDTTANAGKTTDKMISDFGRNNDPKMVELLYQYGRYLMISASRDGQAMNLQGIWNKYSNPAWGSKSTTNINYEMNYWPALTTNLEECFRPFVNKAKALTITGHQTAKTHYGINEGWVLHHNTDLWNRSAPIDGTWGMWPTGGAWISNMLYDAYKFNQNEDFLKDVYPVIQGSAAFLNELMIPQEIDGHTYMVISPSASPEIAIPGLGVDCSYSVTMDNAITRELFADTIEAADILGVDSEFKASVSNKLSQIKPPAVGRLGQLMEWAYDWDSERETHRHISHIYGLFPGNEYSPSTNQTISNAAKNVLNRRGDEGTGWSEAWKLNCWARLEDGEHAYNLVKLLISPVSGGGRLYINLWDAHPPFQIDGNFGFTSGVTEMLLQSQNDEISLLPALPSVWSDGHVNGLCARGNFEVTSMQWSGGRLTDVTILSKSGGTCNVRYGKKTKSFETEKGTEYHLNGNLKLTETVQNNGNIASDGKAAASSGEGSAAIDDSASTSWDTSKGSLTVDMGEAVPVKRWAVKFAGYGSYAVDFDLQYSADGESWKTADQVYGNTKVSLTRTINDISARYFRLNILTPVRNKESTAKISEFELWSASEEQASAGINPYKTMQAEDADIMTGGIQIEDNDGYSDLGYIKDSCVFGFVDVNFAQGARNFTVRASSGGMGGDIELHTGSKSGPVVGKVTIPVTGDWADYQEFSCEISGCKGLQDLYLVCRGDDGYLFNIDSMIFEAVPEVIGDVNGDENFDVKDYILLRDWLLKIPDTVLPNLEKADLLQDNKLDVYDLCVMKRRLSAK